MTVYTKVVNNNVTVYRQGNTVFCRIKDGTGQNTQLAGSGTLSLGTIPNGYKSFGAFLVRPMYNQPTANSNVSLHVVCDGASLYLVNRSYAQVTVPYLFWTGFTWLTIDTFPS